MISKELANYLLNSYRSSLEQLHSYIDGNLGRTIRGQNEIIPYIIAALELISKGNVFIPSTNPSKLLKLNNNPQIGLTSLFKNHHFERECNRYLVQGSQLQEELTNFRAYVVQPNIVIHKEENDSLSIRFPCRAWRDTFIRKLTGQTKLTSHHMPYNHQQDPTVIKSNTTLCLKGHKTVNGQLNVSFSNAERAASFLRLLRHAPAGMMETLANQNSTLSFTNQFDDAEFELETLAPVEISFFKNSKIKDMHYATRMIGQGSRSSSSFFSTLPSEVNKKIVLFASYEALFQENKESDDIDNSYFHKPR